MIEYIAAGFDPSGFGRLTPRLFDLQMRGAVKRIEREADLANHQSYNIAALINAAMAGKLPKFEQVFGVRIAAPQSDDVLEANFMALAKAWGAE